jgi:hypothetical protein
LVGDALRMGKIATSLTIYSLEDNQECSLNYALQGIVATSSNLISPFFLYSLE